MTSTENTSGFHRMTVTGDEHNQAVVVELDMFRPNPVDVNNDPVFVGDPPRRSRAGLCECGRQWSTHYLDGVPVTAKEFHRFERSPMGGIYSDELPVEQR